MIEQRKCRVCEILINIEWSKGRAKGGKTRCRVDSEEGILFYSGPYARVWFCNECWEQVRR